VCTKSSRQSSKPAPPQPVGRLTVCWTEEGGRLAHDKGDQPSCVCQDRTTSGLEGYQYEGLEEQKEQDLQLLLVPMAFLLDDGLPRLTQWVV
jgi:hypothetical protein